MENGEPAHGALPFPLLSLSSHFHFHCYSNQYLTLSRQISLSSSDIVVIHGVVSLLTVIFPTWDAPSQFSLIQWHFQSSAFSQGWAHSSTLEHALAVVLEIPVACLSKEKAASAPAGVSDWALGSALSILQLCEDCEVWVWEVLGFPNVGLGFSGRLSLRGACLVPSCLSLPSIFPWTLALLLFCLIFVWL